MRIDFTPDPALYPFTSRWFDSSHGRLHYVDEGNGPAIMFWHGNPTWSFLYRDIIIGLRDRFRCIAPDYLGFGLSDRPSGFGYTIVLIPAGTATSLSQAVMEHYRGVQPTAEARVAVARMPKEILAARPLLERLAHDVPARLGAKPTLLVWGMKDFAFRPGPNLPRMQAAFDDHVLVELPDAKHYIQEDAPERITEAILDRFG
jgi:pimeloyl-ACP methyl ester carboxylesterase